MPTAPKPSVRKTAPPPAERRPVRIRDRFLLGAVLALAVFALLNRDAISTWLAFSSGFSDAQRAASDGAPSEHSDADFTDDAVYGTPNLLRIPSLGVEAPIVYVRTKSEDAYQQALAYGVGHYPGTAEPGQPGNAYVFGHSSDFAWAKGDYKTVFVLLPKMEIGDLVVASDSLGRTWDFRVIDTKVVEPDDLSVLDQYGNERRMLTLQTSYPIGTALQRYLVITELVGPSENLPHTPSP